MFNNNWNIVLSDEISKEYFINLQNYIKNEYLKKEIYPKYNDIYNAFKYTEYDDIKVVIFDFDETLSMHKDKDFIKHRNESEEKRLGYYLNAYKNADTFFETIEPCVKSEVLSN